jgi:hypothetical protein
MQLPVRFILIACAACLFSCEPENIYTDHGAKLKFSNDTIRFDTIFTSLGSTTRQLKIYNPYSDPLRISSIRLAGGESSMFRMNVDGMQGTEVKNIELRAKDSLYIFIEVTVDPNNQDNPILVHDSLVFNTNGNSQDVDLEAWGQDMHFIKDSVISTQIWTAGKPYLVYNYVAVDSGNTLTIEAGTRIYFHRNSFMLVVGSLKVNGTKEDKVLFSGDRLEEDYEDVPGQWGAIILYPGSINNAINYAIIRNPIVGIQIGSDTAFQNQDLVLSNTKILNASYYGIYAFGSEITAWNTVVADCGTYAIALLRGGDYHFYHCTVSNRGVIFSNRNEPSVVVSNYIDHSQENPVSHQSETVRYSGDLKNALIANSIIYGNLQNEIGIAQAEPGKLFNYFFDHCLIKLAPGQVDISDPVHFNTIIYDELPGFIDPSVYNFALDTLSASKDAGLPDYATTYPLDYEEESRTGDTAPDLGAFERIETSHIKR